MTVVRFSAFESCTALTEINAGTQKNTLPASLTEVGQQAFSSVSALKEIALALPAPVNALAGIVWIPLPIVIFSRLEQLANSEPRQHLTRQQLHLHMQI